MAAPRETSEQRMQQLRQRENPAVEEALDSFFKNTEQEKAVDIAKAVADREFWQRDVATSAKVTGANILSQTAGATSDMIGAIVALRAAADPIGGPLLMQKLGVESPLDIMTKIPGNSEQLAEMVGGDPTHPSWIPAALISPGPGEYKAGLASLGGLVGLQNMRNPERLLGSYNDFIRMEKELGMGPMDMRAVEQTSWVRGHDGKPKILIPDAPAKIIDLPLKEGVNTFKMGEVLDHPDLYEMYPYAADLNVTIRGVKGEDGVVRYKPKREDGEPVANFLSNEHQVNIFETKSADTLKGSLLHEVSHLIEEVEGWSTGAGTYGPDFFEGVGDVILGKKMAEQLGQKKLQDQDAVVDWLRARQIPEEQAMLMMQIARTAGKSEEIYDDFIAQAATSIDKDLRRSAHVFEFLAKNAKDGDLDPLNVILASSMDPRGMEALVALQDQAYMYKLGEVEARLADFTRNWDLQKWAAAGADDPTEAMLRAEAGINPGTTLPNKLTDDIVMGETSPGREPVMPEGTDRILSETEMKLLQNVIDNDPALLKRLLQGVSE